VPAARVEASERGPRRTRRASILAPSKARQSRIRASSTDTESEVTDPLKAENIPLVNPPRPPWHTPSRFGIWCSVKAVTQRVSTSADSHNRLAIASKPGLSVSACFPSFGTVLSAGASLGEPTVASQVHEWADG